MGLVCMSCRHTERPWCYTSMPSPFTFTQPKLQLRACVRVVAVAVAVLLCFSRTFRFGSLTLFTAQQWFFVVYLVFSRFPFRIWQRATGKWHSGHADDDGRARADSRQPPTANSATVTLMAETVSVRLR